MDLTQEHISLLQKTQTVSSKSLSSIDYIHTGIFLSYTETDYLKIHCPIMNDNIDKIRIPGIKKAIFLFDNTLLYNLNDSVKYFSYYDKTILRSFQIQDVKNIEAKPIDDIFMVNSKNCISFYDLRYKNAISRLQIKDSRTTLNNDSWACLLNNQVLIFDHNSSSPRISKNFKNIEILKLTPNNKFLILVTSKSVIILDNLTGEINNRLFVDDVVDVDISEDSQFIFFLINGKVSIFSIEANKLINNILLKSEQKFIKCNPSFAQFCTAAEDFTFYSVDKQTLDQ